MLSCSKNNGLSPRDGLLLLFLSAVLFSAMGIFVKKAEQKGIPSTELTLLRACGQGIFVVLPAVWVLKVPLVPPRHVRGKVILRGIVGGIGFQCYFKTIQCLQLGDAITLSSIYPAFTAILAIPLLGERIDWVKGVAISLSILGAACIAQPHSVFGHFGFVEDTLEISGCEDIGYITGIIGSFCGGLVYVIIRMVGKDGNAIQLIFSFVFFTSLGSLLISLFTQDWVLPKGDQWLDILLVVLFGSLAHYLMNYAARLCPAGAASVMRSTDVLWAYIWEVLIFKVSPNLLAIFGAVSVFISGLIIGLSKEVSEKATKNGFAVLVETDDSGINAKRAEVEMTVTDDSAKAKNFSNSEDDADDKA